MNKSNKVLFFGPYPNPITGQSISFKEVFDNYQKKKILINTTRYNNKYISNFYSILISTYYLLTRKIDVIYFTCSRNKVSAIKDFYLIFLAYIFKIRIVNHLHGADFKTFINSYNFFRKVAFFLYNKVNTTIVLLPSMKSQFNQFTKMKINVVENCYSSDYMGLDINLNSKKNQILYLSNLMYSKGILVFLSSLDSILETNQNTKVFIAGKPMADDFMSRDEIWYKFSDKVALLEDKYPNRIIYLGIVHGKDKQKLLEESSIFVLPTFYKTEALPISIIEAMKFGNAIITTNHNYLADIVSSNNGCLIEPNSVEALKNSILDLLGSVSNLKKIQKHNITESSLKYDSVIFNKKILNILENK
ncbi:glycosyltransferase family 4 protein [Polaribacter sp. P097]|uniref:glycosyltransferase family 4 protein n=1 Tax=Polaribacter sp. P097 TaxID=3117398 RepID=UPI002FE3C3A2